MKSCLKSESGMAFISSIVMVGGLILSYFFISTNYYAKMSQDADRVKRILASYEVVGSLAVELRRAYDMAGPNCPAGKNNRSVNGSTFCVANQTCVQNPLNRLGAAGANQVCWAWNTQRADVTVAGVWPEMKSELVAAWNSSMYKTGEQIFRVLGQFSNEAGAQAGPENHLPGNIAGGPTVNFGNLLCNGVDSIHCQRCTPSAGWDDGACVLLDICLMDPSSGGCPTDNYRVKQWISMVK